MNNFYVNVQASGDKVLIREVKNGKRVNRKVHYKPTLYIKSNKKSKFKTLDGEFVEPIKFESIKESKEWIDKYKDVSQFEIYGNTYNQYCWIADEFPEEKLEFDSTLIGTWSLDIEVESEKGFPNVEDANERVNLITFKDIQSQEIFTFGLSDYGSYKTDRKNVEYQEFKREEDLLAAFLDKWAEVQPDVIMGWNVELFDITYLVNRMHKFFDEDTIRNALSPWGQVRARTVNFLQQEKPTYAISGVAILDLMRLYRKYVTEPRENYRLGFIAQLDLGIGKIDHGEYAIFSDFYKNDWQKYVDYNIRDVELVEQLENKWKLIELTLSVAYQAKVNYDDVISQVRTWDTKIYNALKAENIVIPFNENHVKEPFEGAYVKNPNPGLYRWVTSFDAQSLYPRIIQLLNIGTETKLGKLYEQHVTPDVLLEGKFKHMKDMTQGTTVTIAANGVSYKKDKPSFYSKLIEKLFNDRVEYKKKGKEAGIAGDKNLETKFDVAQKATKVQMNSLYGAMGNEFFRFFDRDNAEAVTLTGQFIIRYIARGVDEFFNQMLKTKDHKFVIYCDTDSVYMQLDELVKKILPNEIDKLKITDFLAKVCAGPLKDLMAKLCGEIASILNGTESRYLLMQREVIANLGIWTAKKRYILNVLDSEGERFGLGSEKTCKKCTSTEVCNKHKDPKLKIMGIEIKKASNPQFCRDRMEESVRIIMNTGDNGILLDFIEETSKLFKEMKPEEISTPKTCNGIKQYGNDKTIYGFKTPAHTKGALLYNHYLKQKDLLTRYQPIQEGEKIKFIYLKLPNPIRDTVIAFNGEIPKEFGLHPYIDYDLQFSKTFLEPLSLILNAIGWKIDRTSSLEGWF